MKDSFVDKVVVPYIQRHGKKKLLLHLDNSPVHKTKDLATKLTEHNIQASFFPPRMTSLLQPADVGWFRSLKSQYYVKWQKWFLNSPKSFTKSNNLKSPGYSRVIEWISQIWRDFDPELIIKSFEATGITSHNPDDYNHLLRVVYDEEVLPTHILIENEPMDELEAFGRLESNEGSDNENEADLSDESDTTGNEPSEG